MRISKVAFDLIVAEEVSSKALYEKKYRRPEWPGEQSGVTIGIGYDVGYATPERLRSDWDGHLPDAMIDALAEACGVRGPAARALTAALHDQVDVPWAAAIAVFEQVDVPRWEKTVRTALDNTDKLSPDCYGALVSLAYNRGASFRREGDRYREMRNIAAYMENQSFALIPGEFRAMKRLWPNSAGLRGRRDREAALFERGLVAASRRPEPRPRTVPPPDIERPHQKGAEPKPAIKSKINWAAIGAFLASVGGLLTDWRVLAVVITGVLLGFIVWNRSGKPDIAGWLR